MANTIIILSAFLFSGLTFFSGFGLATVLTPVFIIFFPAPIAISLVAVIHFFNNLFKFFLVGKQGNLEVLFKFGVPAMIGAVLGSFGLLMIAKKSFTFHYHLLNHVFNVEVINFIIGILILFFALLEITPQVSRLTFNKNLLPIGGVLSGFFGGLSGHQGAFRSIFLVKCNLSKEQFIATGIIIACLVDFIRLLIYGASFFNQEVTNDSGLLVLTIISSFLGTYLSNKYLQKVTIGLIKNAIIILLFAISTGLISGIIK